MDHKKKFHGGLKVLLLLLFTMLLGMSSTCYASTTLSDSEAEYIFDYLFKNTYQDLVGADYYNFRGASSSTSISRYNFEQSYTYFMNTFNTNNTIEVNPLNTIFLTTWSSSTSGYLYWANFNLSAGTDDLSHLYFYCWSNSGKKVGILGIDSSESTTSNEVYGGRCKFTYSNNSFAFTEFNNNFKISPSGTNLRTNITSSTALPTLSRWLNYDDTWLNNVDTSSIINPIPGLCTLNPTAAIYTSFDGNFLQAPYTRLLKTFYVKPNEPVEPSGDNSGDIPSNNGLGNITTPSGDNGGNVNLQPIQDGINNINNSINTQGQAIIENQNQNTQSIIDSQNNNTQQITNTLTDEPDLSNTSITSGDIERCFRL